MLDLFRFQQQNFQKDGNNEDFPKKAILKYID